MANSREVTRENRYRVFSNICLGNAVSLDEHLRNMSGSERSLALNADQSDTFDIFQGEPPLIQAVTSGYLDVVEDDWVISYQFLLFKGTFHVDKIHVWLIYFADFPYLHCSINQRLLTSYRARYPLCPGYHPANKSRIVYFFPC